MPITDLTHPPKQWTFIECLGSQKSDLNRASCPTLVSNVTFQKIKLWYHFKSWVSKALVCVKIQQRAELTLEAVYNIEGKEHTPISNKII